MSRAEAAAPCCEYVAWETQAPPRPAAAADAATSRVDRLVRLQHPATAPAVTAGSSIESRVELRSPCGGLEVRASVIPAAGLGLFAARRFKEEELLPCEYTGDKLTFAQLHRLPDSERDYVMGLHFNTHVNAKHHPGVLARYINDNLVGPRAERHNVKFVKLPKETPPKALVRALRAIEAGEELYADYGDGYWRKHGAGATEEEEAV